MSNQSTHHSRRARNIESDFAPPKALSPTIVNNTIVVKQRTVSEPPEVPPEVLRMVDDEDCPRLASVANVARMRRMSGADENPNHSPHRFRRHGGPPDRHSLLLSMTPEMYLSPSKSPSKNGEMRRSESEFSLTKSKPTAATGIGSGLVPLSPSSKFDIGIADTTGRRDEMEDSCAICGNFGGNPENNFFLLLDGHSGKEAAEIAANKLPACLHDELEAGTEPEEALRKAFRKTHEIVLEEAPHCGTTATGLLFLGESAWVAHVGDSRALIVADDGSTKRLTVDHRASNKEEADAVRARGGFVLSLGGGGLRVNGMISITRALGDKSLAEALTCEPDVNKFEIPNEGTLVLACDGLWDCVTDENAAKVAGNMKLNPKDAAENLRDLAYRNGSFDNISVMVIRAVR